jgi:hypothetical protein
MNDSLGRLKEPISPCAFLSHASEDKAEFVEPLAQALAILGIRPWLDMWEIAPGDSLPERIFEQGIAKSDSVVLVVSRHSLMKPWFRDELDSATVRRIQSGTRLIPIRLDGGEMPAALQHLRWITANRTLSEVQRVAKAIASVMHGEDRRPQVAPPPAYANTTRTIQGLNVADSVLLTEVLRQALEAGQLLLLEWKSIRGVAEALGLTGDALWESLIALGEADLVDVEARDQDSVRRLDLTRSGYAMGIESVIPDIALMHRAIISELVNDPPAGDRLIHDLASRSNSPRLVVDELLNTLQAEGLVSISRTIGDHSQLHKVSPTLKRLLN